MKRYDWDVDKIKKIVSESVNMTEVLQALNIPIQGNNCKTLHKVLEKNNIDFSHFIGRARKYKTSYVNAETYLNGEKPIHSSKLKIKLLKENLIENKCAICGISEWLGKPIVLQLHHINGNNSDNRLENIQLLCPNCDSQTENYCGNANKNKIIKRCPQCGKPISRTATLCTICSNKSRSKKDTPSLEQLIIDFKEIQSYKKIGEKYGVRDNTIKKWFIKYGLPNNIKELKKYIDSN